MESITQCSHSNLDKRRTIQYLQIRLLLILVKSPTDIEKSSGEDQIIHTEPHQPKWKLIVYIIWICFLILQNLTLLSSALKEIGLGVQKKTWICFLISQRHFKVWSLVVYFLFRVIWKCVWIGSQNSWLHAPIVILQKSVSFPGRYDKNFLSKRRIWQEHNYFGGLVVE